MPAGQQKSKGQLREFAALTNRIFALSVQNNVYIKSFLVLTFIVFQVIQGEAEKRVHKMNNAEIKELLEIIKLQNDLADRYFSHVQLGKQDIISSEPDRNAVADFRRGQSLEQITAKRGLIDNLIAKLEASLEGKG